MQSNGHSRRLARVHLVSTEISNAATAFYTDSIGFAYGNTDHLLRFSKTVFGALSEDVAAPRCIAC